MSVCVCTRPYATRNTPPTSGPKWELHCFQHLVFSIWMMLFFWQNGKIRCKQGLCSQHRGLMERNKETHYWPSLSPNWAIWWVACLISCNSYEICAVAHTEWEGSLSWFNCHYYIDIFTWPRIHIDVWGDYDIHYYLIPVGGGIALLRRQQVLNQKNIQRIWILLLQTIHRSPLLGAILLVTVYDKWHNKGGGISNIVRSSNNCEEMYGIWE